MVPTDDGDQILLRHHLRNWQIIARLKTEIAIGQNADQLSIFGDRYARDTIAAHHLQSFGDSALRFDSHWVDDHAAFAALHAIDFFGLFFDRHVAVNDADAALLRERNRHMRLRHGVHSGADEGNFQLNPRSDASGRVGFRGSHLAVRRLQEDVIESKPFLYRLRNHRG